MNKINYQRKGSSAIVDMTISPEILKLMIKFFDIQIELLQGKVAELDDGKTRCSFEITGFKLFLFEDFMKHLANHPAMSVSVMGVDVHKN